MKLIIDIPEWKYKSICEGVEASKMCSVVGVDPDIHEAIYNGTSLDDVKEEIDKAYHDLPRYYPFALNTFAIIVDEILDNIGKAEREDKNELS